MKKLIGGGLLALAVGGALLGCGSANADTYYANCAAAWADHAAPLHRGGCRIPERSRPRW